jgi:hypothetical protein
MFVLSFLVSSGTSFPEKKALDVTQCSQQLNAGELWPIFSQKFSITSSGVIIRLTLIAPSAL